MKLRSAWRFAPAIVATGILCAQGGGFHRTVLLKKDISIPGHETVVARVEIEPGAFVGRHTHPGEEISYVLDGQVDILIEGQPPLHVKGAKVSWCLPERSTTPTTPAPRRCIWLPSTLWKKENPWQLRLLKIRHAGVAGYLRLPLRARAANRRAAD